MPDLNTQQGFSYEGDIYAMRYVNNVLQNKAIGPFEVTLFSAQPSNETIERQANRLGQTGKTRGSVGRTLATELQLNFNAANADLYALLFLGTTTALSVSGSTVASEVIADMEHDKPYKVAHENISALAVTGKTLGTDFEIVDAKLGLVRILSTGTIADGSDVDFAYTYAGITGTTVNVGTESKVDVKLIGNLRNRETQVYSQMIVPKVTLSPNNAIQLIADDYATAELSGKCVLVDGEAADFYLSDPATYA